MKLAVKASSRGVRGRVLAAVAAFTAVCASHSLALSEPKRAPDVYGRSVNVPYLGPLHYFVYEPKGMKPTDKAPTLVLLHGLGSHPRVFWQEQGLLDLLKAAMSSGQLRPCRVVMPEGRSGYWTDWVDGRHPWGRWVVDHLMRDLRARGALAAGPRWTALVGFSMGGFGALSLGLRHPSSFGFVAGMSATDLDIATQTRPFRPVYSKVLGNPIDRQRMRSVNPYQLVTLGSPAKDQRLVIGWGTREPPKFSHGGRRLVRALRAKRIRPRVMVIHRGAHGWKSAWRRLNPWWIGELARFWRSPIGDRPVAP